MSQAIREEITIYATYLVANGGCASFDITYLSRALDLSIATIESYYLSKDEILLDVLKQISLCTPECFLKHIEFCLEDKQVAQLKRKKLKRKIEGFFKLNPLGLAYVHIYCELNADPKFSRFINVIEENWAKTIELIFYMNHQKNSAKKYFNSLIHSIYNLKNSKCLNVTIH